MSDHHTSSHSEEHERYMVQAEWTAALRSNIFKRISLPKQARLIEVGSGTGAITQSVQQAIDVEVFGADIDVSVTRFAAEIDTDTHYTVADGHSLPFANGEFDSAFSHFLLMWVQDPGRLINEMLRIVKRSGWVIAFAEPDYGGRIDYPTALEAIGQLQIDSLRRAGSDPQIGRKLRAMFSEAGFQSVTSGVLGGEWHSQQDERLTRSEWQTLKKDLKNETSANQIKTLEKADLTAWENQTRILFIPTFYAYGQVP